MRNIVYSGNEVQQIQWLLHEYQRSLQLSNSQHINKDDCNSFIVFELDIHNPFIVFELDIHDPAEMIIAWACSEKGKWVLTNACTPLTMYRTPENYSLVLRATFCGPTITEYLLTYG